MASGACSASRTPLGSSCIGLAVRLSPDGQSSRPPAAPERPDVGHQRGDEPLSVRLKTLNSPGRPLWVSGIGQHPDHGAQTAGRPVASGACSAPKTPPWSSCAGLTVRLPPDGQSGQLPSSPERPDVGLQHGAGPRTDHLEVLTGLKIAAAPLKTRLKWGKIKTGIIFTPGANGCRYNFLCNFDFYYARPRAAPREGLLTPLSCAHPSRALPD